VDDGLFHRDRNFVTFKMKPSDGATEGHREQDSPVHRKEEKLLLSF